METGKKMSLNRAKRLTFVSSSRDRVQIMPLSIPNASLVIQSLATLDRYSAANCAVKVSKPEKLNVSVRLMGKLKCLVIQIVQNLNLKHRKNVRYGRAKVLIG